MAEPKRKTSKGRRDRRRSHHNLETTKLVKCPNCGALIKPHTLCESCKKYSPHSAKKSKSNENTKGSETPNP